MYNDNCIHCHNYENLFCSMRGCKDIAKYELFGLFPGPVSSLLCESHCQEQRESLIKNNYQDEYDKDGEIIPAILTVEERWPHWNEDFPQRDEENCIFYKIFI